ncbi:MAG: RagB/SusD family nutrient uptake outer membrane protein [Bacteroidales bacterium]|nr:RagB/SusD family nutrient uptake outer membrane protein [Bacteroidales bacterium]
MKSKIIYITLLTIIFITSCTKKLEVENQTNPDIENIYSDPESVFGVTSSLFYSWYIRAQTHSWSPQMSMMTMADQGTSSWLNSGMFDLSSEPRQKLDNSESYAYSYIFEHYWESLYSVLNTSNDVLKVIDNGMEIGDKGADTEMVRAMSYFIQGLSLSSLALSYDKAFIITNETLSPEKEVAQPYSLVGQAAVESLKKCISIADNNSFVIPADWMNGKDYSNNELSQLAHSYIARIIVYNSRNASENDAADWQAVLDHANKGINSDFQIYMDNVNWKQWVYHYTYERDNWVLVDARIINLMDANYPYHLSSGTDPGPATSTDARLASDFLHTPTCNFKPERGYYHYSFYRYQRLAYTFSNPDFFPEFYSNEIELIKAEAYAHLGQDAQALATLNASSRSTRGNLPNLAASSTHQEIIDAIFYERDLELFVAGFGIGYFDMRRRDNLQKGTLLHFPIPSKELNVLGFSIYSFGGVDNADGKGTSNGDWF